MSNNSNSEDLPKEIPAGQRGNKLPQLDAAQIAIDSANVGIWLINAVTREFLPSNRTKELFGFRADEEMSVEAAMNQILEKYRQNTISAIENAFKVHSSLYVEYPITGYHDHQSRWLSITGGFTSFDETTTYFSGLVMDITEQKKNELKRSKFIGMVSHELKTPLTALKAYVQMLGNWAQKQKDNFAVGALSKVDKQVRKMLNMINSLLNLSSAEVGKIHINKQTFSLDNLLKEVVEETLFITSSHHITVAPCDNIEINADRDKIEQVLVNLLSNAAKYSDKGSAIYVTCSREEHKVVIGIQDEGMGITEEAVEKVFLPHYRVESKETEKVTGFGIGLYLCSEIIQRHDGKIWVDSEIGKGSTFKFILPIA
ncbi:His Kinase A (phospho-acceptor) domain-containing protein [Mucilaginibacter pineti]|uniref:histidine kinase n=1 Tax=Mucilaginibacter pineti TaxID=1391627 RepID=A0A1G7H937_9SPHI|nr:ATP-binding protein [Mucilaginibacter pineti]SDE96784.1 His Kinase A (phospho-acceptor) domain-containing protein [Mucilaginibacter pineti]